MKTGERFGKMGSMSYSKIYRERTIEYRQAGHTLEETHQTFKVARSTIQEWEKQLKETGSLEKKELHRSIRKIDLERLRVYVAEHPTHINRRWQLRLAAAKSVFEMPFSDIR